MRRFVVLAGSIIAILCGTLLLFTGIGDAQNGNARAALPITIGLLLLLGGAWLTISTRGKT
ncbi:hypothetical protein GCM10010273_20190 [Streptomyces lavendulocolor]